MSYNIETIDNIYNNILHENLTIDEIYNKILDRNEIIDELTQYLSSFIENTNNFLFKRGIYIYGNVGIGKTKLIYNLFKKLNYDILYFNSTDIRTKQNLNYITNSCMSDKNIMDMFNKKSKIGIIMDEIDSMNSGDKGGLTTLVKIIRPKKSKKQKIEENTLNPIICISNYYIDKKNSELNSSCNSFDLPTPTYEQIITLMKTLIKKKYNINCCYDILIILATYINYNLHVMNNMIEIFHAVLLEELNNYYENVLLIDDTNDAKILFYNNNKSLINDKIKYNIANIVEITKNNNSNKNIKEINKVIINNSIDFNTYSYILNETDKTTVGLLYHENIIDVIYKLDCAYDIYLKILTNFCFADYIDRITFQRQIWQLNELSSIIKIYNNNHILFNDNKIMENEAILKIKNTRFTKILTKYSTEYNNFIFINDLCNSLHINLNDLFSFFIIYRTHIHNIINIIDLYDDEYKTQCENSIISNMNLTHNKLMFDSFHSIMNLHIITNIDIKRIYRYIDNIYYT
jgi:hypothetical protein